MTNENVQQVRKANREGTAIPLDKAWITSSRMLQTLDPSRWPGGPQICEERNLPAFETEKELKSFIDRHCGSAMAIWQCKFCQGYHFWPTPKPLKPSYRIPDKVLEWLELLYFVSDSESDPIANVRHSAHTSNRTERFFKDKKFEDRLGAKAEIAFGRKYGLKVDTSARVYGDDQIDFSLAGHTVDVKGYQNPFNLFVKEKDVNRSADILVMAEVFGDRVTFLGWETIEVMKLMPKKDFGFGIVNYYREASLLKPMIQLDVLAGKSPLK